MSGGCGTVIQNKTNNMELLNYAGSDYLLNPTLESLHNESVTWLKELAFWSDELTFFYKLLRHKALSDTFPGHEVAEAEKELIRLNSEVVDRLKAEVTSHERSLAALLKSSSSSDEQSYRDKHRVLFNYVFVAHEELRKFKRQIFSFMEK